MKYLLLIVVGFFTITIFITPQQLNNPGKHWMQYKNVYDAGFDSTKLKLVKEKFLEQDGDALLIIRSGKIVLSVGETTRCFRQTSVRKSYLNALYGIYTANGIIDLNSTLTQLDIDDTNGLTAEEKKASILDLMKSRSGVYHPAAYSPESMEKRLPVRGIYKHGEHWFYNNWDFNTLGAIFMKVTQKDIFNEFYKKVALPLEFEDFNMNKTKYIYEYDKSMHPAYSFRMSARDMARFGLLYLNKGRWNNQQILSYDWIIESFKVHSVNGIDSNGTHWDDYGLLWWISNKITIEPVIYASGSGVQRISLFPESNMIMIHLVDNFQPKEVGENEVDILAQLLLESKTGEPIENPEVILYKPDKICIDAAKLSEDQLKKYEGIYTNARMGSFTIKVNKQSLHLETGIGNFILYPIDENVFLNEDILIPMSFENGEESEVGKFRLNFNDQREIDRFIFFTGF
jgi:CubicO group peptidase (beta-lactamase class C family)